MPEQIKRSEVLKIKKRYGMQAQPDREVVEWWRRNYGTGYELEIINDIEDKYCAYCKTITPHQIVGSQTDGHGTGRDLRCTVCVSSRMGEIQGFDAALM